MDIALLGANHLRQGYLVDASGIFASIPATVHVIWGYLLGRLIANTADRKELLLKMFLIGIPTVLLAQIWNYAFPINKTLWTSSYVLYSTGWALIALAFCIWIIDVKQQKRWFSPSLPFGANPLFAYVFAELFGSIMSSILMIPGEPNAVSLRDWLFNDVFAPIAGNLNGSVLYSIFVMVFYWAILWMLYRRKIFIKI